MAVSPLVVIGYLYIVRTVLGPCETYSVLVIYPDAVLSLPVTRQGLKMITGWYLEIVELVG